MAQCSIEGCCKPAKQVGMCWGHYTSKRRYGDPEYASPVQRQLRRFWNNVEKSDGCWTWTGAVFANGLGYGSVYFDGKTRLAHRVSWLIHTGEEADKLVLHHCDNPKCVNPEHLYVGDHKDNARDRETRNRRRKIRGEEIGNSKLAEADVIAIRAAIGTCDELGERFGVSRSLISLIKLRKIWAHVEEYSL